MTSNILDGMRITVDPGHGYSAAYDSFREGPGGEREEWINLRVALVLVKKLEAAGAHVFLTRDTDRDLSLGGRAVLTKKHNSDLLIGIHHNGSPRDSGLDYPIVYFWGEAAQNPASVDFGQILLAQMRKHLTFAQPSGGGVYSDFLIFPKGTSLLRNTIQATPGIIGEAGFFTHPTAEQRLKQKAYNELEAETYYQAIVQYAKLGIPRVELLTPKAHDGLNHQSQLTFQLSDGLGAHSFDPSTIRVLQDDQIIEHEWDPENGRVTVSPSLDHYQLTQADQPRPLTLSLRIFARTRAGNALHPKRFYFETEAGLKWRITQDWKIAYQSGIEAYQRWKSDYLAKQVDLSKKETWTACRDALVTTLHHLRLSLTLQPCHPHARAAEQHILYCLEHQRDMLGLDNKDAISTQTKRVKELYPVQREPQDK